MIKDLEPYWKARIKAIQQLIAEEKGGDRTVINNHAVLLRNGVIPGSLEHNYFSELLKQKELMDKHHDNLSFTEICQFNTWFEMHPEKVAGIQKITTSRQFPISIDGNKEDIIQCIEKTLNKPSALKVKFSFNASNIYIYHANSKELLEASKHDSLQFIKMLKKYPDFTDRESIKKRLFDYYKDIPSNQKKDVWNKAERLMKAKAEALEKIKLLNPKEI